MWASLLSLLLSAVKLWEAFKDRCHTASQAKEKKDEEEVLSMDDAAATHELFDKYSRDL